MSTKTFCDGCGTELASYATASVQLRDKALMTHIGSYHLCDECLARFKRQMPSNWKPA
jgi:RNase P subunit RPR2